MKIKVRDVHPNPYRNIEHYPLNKEKIMALTNSIEKTGFWDNLVGREVDGKVQIAYGHHRIEALRLANGYGYDFEFDLPIKDIDDGTMIQIMANENMQEWSHSIGVIDETVKVAKEYLENTDVQFAQTAHKKARKDYQNQVNAPDIADFLGWTQGKVSQSLRRLRLIDEGVIEKEAVLSLPSSTHATNFSNAINASKVKFTPQEQKQIAKEIVGSGDGERQVKQRIEAKAFEKKHGKDFGKKKKEKANQEILEFDKELGKIADETTQLSERYLKLKNLKDELQSVTSKKGLLNLKFLFLAFGDLERRMQKFKDAMTENTEDITKEYINEVKQLNQ